MVIRTDTSTLEPITMDTPFGPVTFQYSKFTTTLQTEVRDKRVFTIGPTPVQYLGFGGKPAPLSLTRMPKNSLHDYKEYYQLFYNLSSSAQHYGPNFDAMYNAAKDWERHQAKLLAKEALNIPTYEITIGTGGFGVETVVFTKDEFRNKITELEDSLETWNESYRRSPSTGGRRGIDLSEIRMASLLAEWERHVGSGPGSSVEDMVRSQMSFSGATTDVSITTGGVKYDIPRSEIMTQTEMVRQGNEELGIPDDVFIEGLGGSVADVETAGTEITIDEETTLEDKQDDTDDWISRNLMPKARTIAIVAGAAGFAYLLSRKRSKRR